MYVLVNLGILQKKVTLPEHIFKIEFQDDKLPATPSTLPRQRGSGKANLKKKSHKNIFFLFRPKRWNFKIFSKMHASQPPFSPAIRL